MTTPDPGTLTRRRRRTTLPALVMAALAGLTGGALVATTPAAAADTLLSQGKPVTVSSTESAAFPGSAAVDGDAGTRWSSAFADPQWIQIDLGSSQPLTSVVLRWEAAFGRGYQIQVSANASTWTTVYSTSTGPGGTETLPVSGTGRYVRMLGSARATQYGYSLWEFQVFGPGTGGGSATLLSYGKPGVASSSQNDGGCGNCTPAKALDRDPATRWATAAGTGWVDPGWIYVDLGATATISQVVLQWDPAYATAYQLQTSADAANWTTIYSTAAGHGFREAVNVTGTGRYVRMFGTARGSPYGYSLWEFQVYGTGGAPTAPPALPPNVTFPATRLVFGDEFNTPAGSTPDGAKWTPETGPGVNNELEYYTNNRNAATDGAGNLVLEVRRETTAGSSCPGGPCQYTSARLNTASHFSFTYGHVEARIKVSGTAGLWPAFWLLGANFSTVSWPACGEIDIMEHVGRAPNAVYSTLHAPAYNGGNGFGAPFTIGGDFASAFHTYAVDWDSTHMTFYVDGTAFFTVNKASLETSRGPWVYDHPFFLLLNNAIGGDFPGPPDGSTVLPQRMSIDYVRVFQ
ncbi:MAG TPA: discoidin domain-containing protein [Mycobacteriales bacterium]|nr:discoidin domain-containing protein [Mycobacteriales bacterium]